MLLAMAKTPSTRHDDVHLMGGCWFPQLAFTGSTEVGKLIATETAKNVVATTLELVRHTKAVHACLACFGGWRHA